METPPGARFINRHPNINPKDSRDSWLTLAGLADDVRVDQRRGLRRKFNTAVDGLRAHDLISLEGAAGQAGRYRSFTLQKEDASNTPYTVPGDDTARREAITLPTAFFLQGWHLVLTDLELVTLLAIIDRTGQLRLVPRSGELRDKGVDLKKQVRFETYGLSDEAYNTVHMLDRFGLIDVEDPMPNRSNPARFAALLLPTDKADESANTTPHDAHSNAPGGKSDSNERVPYRLIYPSETAGIDQFPPALDTVLGVLPEL
ncbi:hypothetical protein I0Q12_00020 [Rhodococcus sp. CX]|uniref:hypothetical protein n=1 Tax=Rhodococcus sp. CX TaxID=2789880 RepID=UPI0018CF6B7E|nr:hypothetical protein [Rhodococcus sp. CX]MBH0118002.1 hypothetical protein [Rhodococcus sp. CX]